MSSPADWGAVPVADTPTSWGAIPDKPEIDTPQNKATIERRNREATNQKAFLTSVAQDTQPGLLARMGRGMLDLGQGVNQGVLNIEDAIGGPRTPQTVYNPQTQQNEPVTTTVDPTAQDYTQQVNQERTQYDQNRAAAGEVGPDWARMFGTVAAAAPSVLVAPQVSGPAWLARGVAGGAAGGVAGATEFSPTNSALERGKNALVGAATGAVVAPVAGAIGDQAGNLYRAAAGRAAGAGEIAQPSTVDDIIQQVPEIARVPQAQQGDLIAEAQAQLRQTGQLNAEQLGRRANLLAQGVTPTRSMVTRDPADWSIERNLQKLAQSPDESLAAPGRELTDIYQGNDAALAQRLGQQAHGLPGGNMEAQGQALMEHLDNLSTASQGQVTEAYNAARATAGGDLASDGRTIIQTLHDPEVADNAYSEPIINSVNRRLRRLGMLDDQGQPTTNTMTVNQSEEFRKFLGTLRSGDPRTDRLVTRFIRATDADVLNGAGTDAMAPARQAAAARFQTLGNPATDRALNSLSELNQGKTAQHFIQTNIINGADQDVNALIGALEQLPAAQQTQAMGNIRAGVVRHLQDRAINENSGQFSGAKLNSALNDLGEAKLTRIFGAQSAQELRDLARAGLDATYQPPYAAVNNSNTAPMLLSLTRNARAIPGVPLVVSQNAEQLAARAGYARQLAQISAAQSQVPEVPIPNVLHQIAGLMPRVAGPTGAVNARQTQGR